MLVNTLYRLPPPRFTGHHPHFPQHHHANPTGQTSNAVNSSIVPIQPGEIGFDGKMLRKAMARKTVDYNPSIIRYLENSIWQRNITDGRSLQPDVLYIPHLVPPHALLSDPVNCVMTKFIRPATNKVRCPIFCVCWTPDGRRLITGASSGEFTLWNGLTFNFETILQAHDSAVRAMIWSNNEQWMLTGDHNGFVKYWQSNMNNVKVYQAHNDPVRGLTFSPNDTKFASCSDDSFIRIFDFMTGTEERELRGHGSDVKCVDWHPHKGILVSGSKDSQQPIILWDPKSGKKLATLHAHKNTCMAVKWNRHNGNWLLSASRDHFCKVFDIRNLKEELQCFRGHKKEACTLAWHPIHERLFSSGGSDGSIYFWLVGTGKELAGMDDAHEGMIWDMSWHPLGHMLVSGSNDHTTRFWTRNRSGDTVLERSEEGLLMQAARLEQLHREELEHERSIEMNMPGLGFEGGLLEQLQQQQQQEEISNQRDVGIPGLEFSNDDEESRRKRAPFAKPVPKTFEKAWRSVDAFAADTNNSNRINPHESNDPYFSQPSGNFSHGASSMHDDYSRNNGPSDFDARGGGGPPMKRPRHDVLVDGHWSNAPTDRRGIGFSPMPPQGSHWRQHTNDMPTSSSNILDETLGETLTAAQQGVSPFFQNATDEELRGFNQTLRIIQK
ncbi:unnamed protein product [Rotaria socialis]|uniref:pre-mRNA 3' end processing protein WDR33 n=1 Tax=Rotaria socialis TaxID=392032 RepID=A0A821IW03_9BILA|nr:unnamed protein product [Rotaria socialis]CAF4371950.1 unnamed protein product [Rotaria socialis]CAF4478009.1 unnamed protein product [Rotaria socialis]CAF4711582.1 unnamed protein product [Rotaria socialis]CAF4806070.1 unnamed protein product [Rotaria socialis]